MAPTDLEHWSDLRVGAPLEGGERSQVWEAMLGPDRVVIRSSRRGADSLDWELALLVDLRSHGFCVPDPIPTDDQRLRAGLTSVHRWIDGRPPTSPTDWAQVASELRRVHRMPIVRPQRPGAASVTSLGLARRSVDADLDRIPASVVDQCLLFFDAYLEAQLAVVHGDPMAGNVRLTSEGRVGLIDWDEARIDIPDLDLANLGVAVLSGDRRRTAEWAADAWETLNGWTQEPDYARMRLARLPTTPAPAVTPVLTDGTISLRARTVSNAEAQIAGEDDQIVRWLTGGRSDLARTRQHIAHVERAWLASGVRRNFGIYLADEPETLVGNVDVNLADTSLELDEANISYAVFPTWRRRGVATHALALAVDYVQGLAGEVQPVVKIDPANSASRSVAARAGFIESRSIDTADGQLSVYVLASNETRVVR